MKGRKAMKVRKELVIKEIDGEIVAIPTGKLVKKVKSTIYLTESGRFIVETLQKENLDTNQIAERLVDRYKIDMNTAKTDTERFVEKLKENNIIKTGLFS